MTIQLTFHVHDVMEMMIETGETYTRESLVSAIAEKFGPQATFHSCSEQGMIPSMVVDFLESRGKFVPAAEGFTTDASKRCSH